MDNTSKFTGKAELYDKFRPSYPKELYDFIFREFGLTERSAVADVGSGTGKFAAPLAATGATVYCVEPNADMRFKAQSLLGGGFVFTDGTAEHTGLSDGCVDLITAAQAFHWFDADAFRAECRRILRPGGRVLLVWNIRRDCGIKDALKLVNEKYCPGFVGFSGGMDGERSERTDAFFGSGHSVRTFDNDAVFENTEEFVGRCFSASYAPKGGEAALAYADALRALYGKFSVGGKLTVPMFSAAYYGSV